MRHHKPAGLLVRLILLGLSLIPAHAFAWGSAGHATVAIITEHLLTPTAHAKVQAILGEHKLSDHEIALWPDFIRGNKDYALLYPGNSQWHYINFEVTKNYSNDFAVSEDGQDIVSQIQRSRLVLVAPESTPEQQLDALRFLVHFVGDLHQPLHCSSRRGDLGGNMLPVNSFSGEHYSFSVKTPMDYPPSLHSVWDDPLVQELMAGKKPKALAKQLEQDFTPERVQRWRAGEPLDWAVESYQLARKQAYRWSNGKKVPSKWSRPGMDLTSGNYIASKLPYVQEQLQKAGVRLAHMLNTALDPSYTNPPATE